MQQRYLWRIIIGLFVLWTAPLHAQSGTEFGDDLDNFFDRAYGSEYEDLMVERIEGQIERYFDGYTNRVVEQRHRYWNRDLSSWSDYRRSIRENRTRFREIIGVVDERETAGIEFFSQDQSSTLVGETPRYSIFQVRWPVLDGIRGEGLLLRPKGEVAAHVVAYPEADQTPEQLVGLESGLPEASQYARRLAETGVEVLVPVVIDRDHEFSGGMRIPRYHWREDREEHVELRTNQPHREWIYRQSYVNGRHLIGYEVQKGLAAVDWFEQQGAAQIGVAGYGEGGLLAFYAAAVDERINAALVSGYFGPREELWREPVYRNVWGLLKRFGDAEIAGMVMPRSLILEYSEVPNVQGPGEVEQFVENERWNQRVARHAGSAGELWTPGFKEVSAEIERVNHLFADGDLQPNLQLVHDDEKTTGPGSSAALSAFTASLGIDGLGEAGSPPEFRQSAVDNEARMERQMEEITRHLMRHVVDSDFTRYRYIDGDLSSPQAWDASMERYRDSLYEQIIGRLPEELPPPNVHRRQIFDRENWVGYEVVMDVLPGVRGWGLLAVPKDIEQDEKRPLVVAQHGAGGTPTTPLQVDSYNNLLSQLVERGFVVFAPHAPYSFNVRRATPVRASVYSVIIPQYRQTLDWLKTLDYVDAGRIGFYGKSWGGRTALRVPPLLDDFKLAICSAYFNQWPRKAMDPNYSTSYLNNGSIGVLEFNQGNTFGHAEMAQLMAPRPYMVENGYYDGVKPDEWAAYEFAKVKRVYQLLGVGDRAVFGSHIGGHEVHADTIFPFLHEYLKHPVPATN
jgi:dienelactone hydrolase